MMKLFEELLLESWEIETSFYIFPYLNLRMETTFRRSIHHSAAFSFLYSYHIPKCGETTLWWSLVLFPGGQLNSEVCCTKGSLTLLLFWGSLEAFTRMRTRFLVGRVAFGELEK
jgi:hypothetical protein